MKTEKELRDDLEELAKEADALWEALEYLQAGLDDAGYPANKTIIGEHCINAMDAVENIQRALRKELDK